MNESTRPALAADVHAVAGPDRGLAALSHLARVCKRTDEFLPMVALRHLRYRAAGRNIVSGSRVVVRGLDNIRVGGLLTIGMSEVGFVHRYDRTYLNVRGRLDVRSDYSIARGCRFDIGPDAAVSLGSGMVNAATRFIIMHGLTVGDRSVISWGCELLDDDFHRIEYDGCSERTPSIHIGDHVWVGANSIILKGSHIASECVVASGAVVSGIFDQPACLLAGNPARVVRERVRWS